MKRIAFILPTELHDDGRVFVEFSDRLNQMIAHLRDEYEITLIVRQIRDKLYEDLPQGIFVLYDAAKPGTVAVGDSPSYTQVNIRSWETAALLDGTYDCVIAFQGLSPWCLATALNRVTAKRKLIYLQRKPSMYLLQADIPYFTELFGKFDGVLCATEQILADFQSIFKEIPAIWTCPAWNRLRYEKMATAERAEDFFEGNTLNLTTVNSFSADSRAEKMSIIAKALKAEFPHLRWYIFGDGDQRSYLLRDIVLNDVCEMILPVGKVENPFPYIEICDGYVNLDDEDQDEVIGAQMLGVPVFTIKRMKDIPAFAVWLKSLKNRGRRRENTDWPHQKKWIESMEGASPL